MAKNPDGMLVARRQMSAEEVARLREEWASHIAGHAGREAQRTLVLSGGVEFIPLVSDGTFMDGAGI